MGSTRWQYRAHGSARILGAGLRDFLPALGAVPVPPFEFVILPGALLGVEDHIMGSPPQMSRLLGGATALLDHPRGPVTPVPATPQLAGRLRSPLLGVLLQPPRMTWPEEGNDEGHEEYQDEKDP
jgi:hypothetical protein